MNEAWEIHISSFNIGFAFGAGLLALTHLIIREIVDYFSIRGKHRSTEMQIHQRVERGLGNGKRKTEQ